MLLSSCCAFSCIKKPILKKEGWITILCHPKEKLSNPLIGKDIYYALFGLHLKVLR